MNTPIYDFLKGYADKNTARLHMPGHKGKSPLPELEKLYSLDITEIFGADSLFEANGIIRESEKNASALFGWGLYSRHSGNACDYENGGQACCRC